MADQTHPKNAEVEQRLRTDPIIWLTTVRAGGRPHMVAVWFLWDGEQFLIFSQPNTQKIRNLRQNSHVTLALDDTHEGEDVIVIDGEAELLNNPDVSATLAAYTQKYAESMQAMNMTAEQMAQTYSQGIRIRPTKFY
jgi:PPOX class probable F420-dependent enzyme